MNFNINNVLLNNVFPLDCFIIQRDEEKNLL